MNRNCKIRRQWKLCLYDQWINIRRKCYCEVAADREVLSVSVNATMPLRRRVPTSVPPWLGVGRLRTCSKTQRSCTSGNPAGGAGAANQGTASCQMKSWSNEQKGGIRAVRQRRRRRPSELATNAAAPTAALSDRCRQDNQLFRHATPGFIFNSSFNYVEKHTWLSELICNFES